MNLRMDVLLDFHRNRLDHKIKYLANGIYQAIDFIVFLSLGL
jgi:hypothetical protein